MTGSMSGVVKSMDSSLRSMNLEKVGYLLNYSLIYFSWNADRGQDYFLLSLGFWAKNNAEYPSIYVNTCANLNSATCVQHK